MFATTHVPRVLYVPTSWLARRGFIARKGDRKPIVVLAGLRAADYSDKRSKERLRIPRSLFHSLTLHAADARQTDRPFFCPRINPRCCSNRTGKVYSVGRERRGTLTHLFFAVFQLSKVLTPHVGCTVFVKGPPNIHARVIGVRMEGLEELKKRSWPNRRTSGDVRRSGGFNQQRWLKGTAKKRRPVSAAARARIAAAQRKSWASTRGENPKDPNELERHHLDIEEGLFVSGLCSYCGLTTIDFCPACGIFCLPPV